MEPDPVFTEIPISIYARRLVADTELAKRTLGFEPSVTLEQGVELELANAFRLHGGEQEEWARLVAAQTAMLRD
ncbi:hypothetical protein [Actinomadura sp. BRA 177]|uniref:hypothetical protein n=1 Tax=Actinomadura sp. BRA 177 TaxID=2745202 RepID=UPI001595E62F|nr:hypothetical protein [Actinomadura sp. BRA 177]